MLRSTFASSLLFFSFSANAADPINTTWIGNLAVKGYDSVAYFTKDTAVKGSKDHQIEWMGANWRFSSAENLALFQSDPEKYAPQYGGYCAYAVSNNATANIDPEAFHIHEGKLYLNYDASVEEDWLLEKVERINLADQYFPGLID